MLVQKTNNNHINAKVKEMLGAICMIWNVDRNTAIKNQRARERERERMIIETFLDKRCSVNELYD